MIDIIILVAISWAVIKGFQKGLIVAVCSFLAAILGLAAAVKLSAIVAEWLGTQITIGKQWYPALSFAIVFIAVVFLIRLLAGFIEKTVQFAMLGWVNKLGGILFYALLYGTFLSVLFFYAIKLNIFASGTVSQSLLYGYIKPLGPWFINGLGVIVPFFKDVFEQLNGFFDNVAQFNKATTI